MNKFSIKKFQEEVDNVLIRHRSMLDVLSKLHESCARINRAVAKSSTSCGCIKLHGKKQEIPADISYSQLNQHMSSHLEGDLCDVCREKIEEEISAHFFYLSALSNHLDVDLQGLLTNYLENHLKTLGKYSLL